MSRMRLTRRMAFGLTLAAIAIPAPAAAQDLRSPDARDGAPVSPAAHDLRSPDARSVVTTGAVYGGTDLRSPDSRDAGDGRGTFSAPDVMVVRMSEPATAPPAGGDGIDWGDAGIGAGALLGLALLGLGGVLAAGHRRRTATPA